MFIDSPVHNNYQTVKITPPWKILNDKKMKDEDFIKWFQETNDVLQWMSQDRIETFVNNILWYTGEYDRTLEYGIRQPGQITGQKAPRRMVPRIFNHLHDITEQRVSKLARLKPDFDVAPTNNEEKDRLISRLMKSALQAMARRVHLEFLMQEVERWNAVLGEIYVSIEWNPDIGDKKSRGSVERVGDVDVKLKPPWTVFPEPKRQWKEVTWCIDIESIMHIDEARKRFSMPNLEEDGKTNIFIFNNNVEEKREDEVVVYRLTIPPSQYMPNGNMTYIIGDKIVSKIEKYPYTHNEFPWERHTDLDIPGCLFPKSFYQQIKPIQHVYNKLTSIITRNILLCAHPHILMPKGAAKIEAFGNTNTAIEYQGPVAPQIITFKSVPQEVFQFRNDVRDEIGQVSGIQGVSRGAPPAGARAASMLRFYEEQEEQRASTSIIKHNEIIRNIYLKAGGIIGDYYPTTSKDRLIRVVGQDNQYDIEAFQNVKISSEYDIIISNSTGFAESKAVRIEEIKELLSLSPGLLSNDQVADILELQNVQKAYDIGTAALREDENQRFLDAKDVASPQPYQDLITHWRIHAIAMNSSTWENSIPQAIKQRMIDHQMTTERLMEEKAVLNATFAQLLANLPNYPMFWAPTPVAPEESKQSAPQNGAGAPPPAGRG